MIDYLGAGALIAERIRAKAPDIKRVELLGNLYALLEKDPAEMAKALNTQSPVVFVGLDGEQIGDSTGDGITHVAEQHWMIVLAVANYRKSGTAQGVLDEAGPLLGELIVALAGWTPDGFTALHRQAAPRPGYLAGVGFFPMVFTTDLIVEGLEED